MLTRKSIPLIVACLAAGCASSSPGGGPREIERSHDKLINIAPHVRPDATISNAPVTTATGPRQPANPSAPTVAEVMGNQPTAGVDRQVLDTMRRNFTFVQQRGPGIELPDGAGGCDVVRMMLYTRFGDRNPAGVAGQDEKTGELYWPEGILCYFVGTDHEINVQTLRVCFPIDSTHSKSYDVEARVIPLQTDLSGLRFRDKDGQLRPYYGANRLLFFPFPKRLSDEVRGRVRDANGNLVLGENGKPVIDQDKMPVFHFWPENIYVTDQTFSDRSNAIGARPRGCDLDWAIQPRKDGAMFGFDYLPDNPSEGPDRVLRITD